MKWMLVLVLFNTDLEVIDPGTVYNIYDSQQACQAQLYTGILNDRAAGFEADWNDEFKTSSVTFTPDFIGTATCAEVDLSEKLAI